MNLLTCETTHIVPVKAKPITSSHMSVIRASGNTKTLHLEGLPLLLCNASQPLFLKKKKVLQEKTALMQNSVKLTVQPNPVWLRG